MPKPSPHARPTPPPPPIQESPDPELVELAPFMRCRCIEALPGRGCMRCSGTKWMKRCHDCNGSGLLFKNVRRGAEPRSERCGRCVGIGWTSAMPADRTAIAAYEASLQLQPAAI